MKTSKNRNERFESKAHGAQRTRQHAAVRRVAVQTNLQVMSEPPTIWVGEERAPRNAIIEARSRFLEIF